MFAQRLKGLRKSHNLTQLQLAEKIGKAKSTIAGYEKGFRKPMIKDLNILSELFNTSSDYLLGLTNDISPKETSRDLAKLLKEPDFHYKGQRLNNQDLDFLLQYLERVTKLNTNNDTNNDINNDINNDTDNTENCVIEPVNKQPIND